MRSLLPQAVRLPAVLWTIVLASGSFPALLPAQQPATADAPVAERVPTPLAVRESYLDAAGSVAPAELPVGVFDSGTGGLAVLEEILRLDEFDNATRRPRPGGDGRPDFEDERFLFLADQANMPYGNYPAAGKREVLVELILCDAGFLLAPSLFPHTGPSGPVAGRLPAKTIVIACNTATAHGKPGISSLIDRAEIDVGLVDVIDAGARGALELLRGAGEATVGVLATAGTVGSGAYPAALRRLAADFGVDEVTVVQQGSIGLAGAIDGVPDFIDPAARRPRPGYRGPSLHDGPARIDASILPRYAFDDADGRMLWDGDRSAPTELQINAVANYVAYECVSLLERLREQPGRTPLSVVILGCTHFPYHADLFAAELRRLRELREDGRPVYGHLIAERVALVDPAVLAARQLYTHLRDDGLLRPAAPADAQTGDGFYITVPDREHPDVRLDDAGAFLHGYKYGREPGLWWGDVDAVPLTPAGLDPDTRDRLRRQLPAVWGRLEAFGRGGP